MTGADFASLAQRAGEERLEELLLGDEDGEDCDCVTCMVREVLTAAWPHLLNLAKDVAKE